MAVLEESPGVAKIAPSATRFMQRLVRRLGPGLITGASDDDPSGIGTYTIAGARFGYSPLWTTWFLFPLMLAVQIMCARLGMVSGKGLGALLRERFGKPVFWIACLLLLVANIVNIGADLGAMSEATHMILGGPSWYLTPLFTILLIALLSWSSYRRIAQVFKWMTLALFAYLIAAFTAHPDWKQVFSATLIPRAETSSAYATMLLALAGTTISPYLFFWQASQEVEEDRDKGRVTVAQRRGATTREIRNSRVDVTCGMLFSQLIMYFVILTSAATLHGHGNTAIETTGQAAAALRPLAGQAASLLFTFGIVGSGMLSVPVLAGSAAFAIAEGAGWRNSLAYHPRQARPFYAVLFAGLVAGALLNYIGLDVIPMLYWSAVINGFLAPPLLILVVVLSSDRRVMQRHASGRVLKTLGWLAAAVMTVAAASTFLAK